MVAARAADVDVIAASLPGAELGTSWGDRPTWKVSGKGFVLYRAPHGTAIDPETGEPFTDLLVVFTPDMSAKEALVQADGPFIDIPHFHGHPGVLVQLSRLGEIERDELVEIITEAWAHRAPPRVVAEHLGEPVDAIAELPAPARRALSAAGITTPQQAAAASDAELLALHGFGPKALRTLRAAL
ncbi:MAG: MmcQ/YjbR family DNA-binding protein [Mobilicoccus sp.]|nr:MmcQ/YjbR family DNA-binding protein [Mobilicoccus sp.]